MSKAERLNMGDSLMTHAMIFTGVDLAEPRPAAYPTPATRPDKSQEKAGEGDGGAAAEKDEKDGAGVDESVACPPPPPAAVPADFAVHVNQWRVENSHGERGTGKGHMCMTDAWFDEYNYQVAIDRSRLAPELQAVLESDEEVTVLPPWDPLGALARAVPPAEESDED